MFERVRTAVSALEVAARELEPELLLGADAASLLQLVARDTRVCAALETLLARRVDETGVWKTDGHRSAAHWMAQTTGETVGAACRTLETARAPDELPATAEAFRSGELSETQAAAITSAAGDGAWRADICMTPDAGARFDSAWEARIDRIFRDARRAGHRQPRAAYAADALVALATEGPCKPTEVRVTVDTAALARGHTETGECCEISGIGPVPVTTARALLDDATVSVVVRDGDDITTVSRPTRTIPAKLRRALEARYPTCGVNSCANDRFLEIDHVVPLENRGRTELANTWRICPHHHALKTHSGWQVVGRPGDRDLVPPTATTGAGRAPP